MQMMIDEVMFIICPGGFDGFMPRITYVCLTYVVVFFLLDGAYVVFLLLSTIIESFAHCHKLFARFIVCIH